MSVLLVAAAAVLAGCLLAVQASVNQQLSKAVGTPYGASTIQLLVALAVVGVVTVAAGQAGAWSRVGQVDSWWLLVGGVASPLYITAGIVLFPRIGALAATGLFVTGQVLCSVLLDVGGWLGVTRQAFDATIAVGAAAVVLGIAIVVRVQPSRGTSAPTAGRGRAGLVGLGLVAGAALPVQGALNAGLQEELEASFAVATVSFLVAVVTILVTLAVAVASGHSGAPRLRSVSTMPWWGWLGGLCAASYVTATFLAIPRIGAAVTVSLTVTGQQVASALVDHAGWLRMQRRPVTTSRLAGLGLLVTGTVLVQVA